jgi:hypothetical protein
VTTGDDNVFVGEDAGGSIGTGDDNTAIGNQAMGGRFSFNATYPASYQNTAVGNNALSDIGDRENCYKNTAVGDSAGVDNGGGIFNTYIGQASGAANEYADYNTFIGARAGYDNNRTNNTNNANRNTYVGFEAGYTNREGEDNVFIGYQADFRGNGSNGNGSLNSRNVVVGSNTRFGATSNNGRNNGVVIGADGFVDQNDVTAVGYRNRVTGTRSVSVGAYDTITATDGVSIGYDARVEGTYGISIGRGAAADSNNSIAIGYLASVNASNEVSIGNSTTNTIGGYVNWSATSDGRFKTNVIENVVGLDFIDALRPVTYSYDIRMIQAFYGRNIPEGLEQAAMQKSKITYSGFIAQEVEEAAKALGYDFSGIDAPANEKDAYALRYAEFVVPLVKATQELHQKVRDQESVISQQQELLGKYEQAFDELNRRMEILEARVEMEHADDKVAMK